MAIRVYEVAYLWSMDDADTVRVLIPLGEPEYETWKVVRIRIEGLRAPESWTEEGKLLVLRLRAQLFSRWQMVRVERKGMTFNRYVGSIQFDDGTWWRDKVLAVMEDMGIAEGGM